MKRKDNERKQIVILSITLFAILSIFIVRLMQVSTSDEAQNWHQLTAHQQELMAVEEFRQFVERTNGEEGK